MPHKVNCKKIYDLQWCNDERMMPAHRWFNWNWAWTKPMCVFHKRVYGKTADTCPYQEKYERPAPPPAPSRKD